MAIAIEDLLNTVPADTEERVERTRDRIVHLVRESIRHETGLVLNRREGSEPRRKSDTVSVPITLAAGVPEVLRGLEFDDAYWLAVKVSPFRSHLIQARDGLAGMRQLVEALVSDERGRQLISGRDPYLPPTSELVAELLALIDRHDPVDRILAVNRDVLGCYVYTVHQQQLFDDDVFDGDDGPFSGRIELYWGVIGLLAGMMGVSIESLTAGVLTHELAHAYTHLGADIDGKRWNSRAFDESEDALTEGLAQYYTHLVAKRLERVVRGTVTAYNTLLERQSDTYRTHMPWIEGFSQEEVRLAMLEVRRHGIRDCTQFDSALLDARKRLRKMQEVY